MRKVFVLCFLLAALPAFGADDASFTVPQAAGAKVAGLELTPADQTVDPEEGFVAVTAKCEGSVKFLVLGSQKVKWAVAGNTVIVSVPNNRATILVFAVGLVDNKLTDFAKTTIEVKGDDKPVPDPIPKPSPKPLLTGKLHVTLIEDPQNTSPDIRKLAASTTLRDSLAKDGHFFRKIDVTDPILKQKGLLDKITAAGGAPVLVIQTEDGRLQPEGKALPIPKTEADLLKLVKDLTGK